MTARVGVVVILAIGISFGCAMRPPEIKSMYIGAGQPMARADSAWVDVFLRAEPPTRPYVIVGTVEVMTERSKRPMDEMLEYARREARKLGGDALIIETSSVPTAGTSVPVRNLYTGETMYHRNVTGTRRTVMGSVIRWKE